MTIKKCDRCGAYYDDNTKCEITGVHIIGVATTIGKYVKDIQLYRNYDLCDDCRRSFYKWLAME